MTLKTVADSVGTAPYIIDVTSGFLSPVVVPALFLLLGMVIAFSTGTSWGTYAVIFPVAMPLAYSINPDPFFEIPLALTAAGFAAVLYTILAAFIV